MGKPPFFSLFKKIVRSAAPLSGDICGTASWVLFSKLKSTGISDRRDFLTLTGDLEQLSEEPREDRGSVSKTRGCHGFTISFWGEIQENVFDGFMLQIRGEMVREITL